MFFRETDAQWIGRDVDSLNDDGEDRRLALIRDPNSDNSAKHVGRTLDNHQSRLCRLLILAVFLPKASITDRNPESNADGYCTGQPTDPLTRCTELQRVTLPKSQPRRECHRYDQRGQGNPQLHPPAILVHPHPLLATGLIGSRDNTRPSQRAQRPIVQSGRNCRGRRPGPGTVKLAPRIRSNGASTRAIWNRAAQACPRYCDVYHADRNRWRPPNGISRSTGHKKRPT